MPFRVEKIELTDGVLNEEWELSRNSGVRISSGQNVLTEVRDFLNYALVEAFIMCKCLLQFATKYRLILNDLNSISPQSHFEAKISNILE